MYMYMISNICNMLHVINLVELESVKPMDDDTLVACCSIVQVEQVLCSHMTQSLRS